MWLQVGQPQAQAADLLQECACLARLGSVVGRHLGLRQRAQLPNLGVLTGLL